MSDYMELKSNAIEQFRPIRQSVNYPRPPHYTGAKIGQINAYSSAKAMPPDYYEYKEDVIVNGEALARNGDKWWRVYSANGTDIIGWCAEIHLSKRYLNVRLISTTTYPPPTEKKVAYVVIYFDDGTFEEVVPRLIRNK